MVASLRIDCTIARASDRGVRCASRVLMDGNRRFFGRGGRFSRRGRRRGRDSRRGLKLKVRIETLDVLEKYSWNLQRYSCNRERSAARSSAVNTALTLQLTMHLARLSLPEGEGLIVGD